MKKKDQQEKFGAKRTKPKETVVEQRKFEVEPISVNALEAALDEVTLSEEQVKQILAERARDLAQEPESDELTEESLQLLTFSLSAEKYAIHIDYVQEVQPIRGMTPVPCTPDFVCGACNLRGNVLSVLDIRRFFNMPAQKITPASRIVVVDACDLKVGLLVDLVHEIERIPISEIEPPIATLSGVEQEYICGVTKDMLIVLDIVAVMSDKRVVIDEDVA